METPVVHPSRTRRLVIAALAAVLVAAPPVVSGAQHARHRVVVSGGIGFPYYYPHFYPYFYPYYGPYWGPWGWWGPYPYYYPLIDYSVSSMRVQVKPNDAHVFVDGYFAGEVDKFDNIFQRLQVRPGGHDIAIHHDQYRTFRQQIFFAPGGDQKLELQLEPLAPGETAEPPPPPSEPEPVTPPGRTGEAESQTAQPVQETRVREGVLSMRVVPGDAQILIGGERWSTPAGQERLTISLPEGRYTLEVSKAGYTPYVQDILVRRYATLRLTVTLEPVRR